MLGVTAGCLEGFLVLETGVMPPSEIVLNVAFLAIGFSVSALLWARLSRDRPGAFGDDIFLLLLSVLTFALRGCLHGCDESVGPRVGIPLGIFLAAASVQWGARSRLGGDSPRTLIATASMAMAFASLDFAARDGLVLGATLAANVLVGMLLLGVLNAFAVGRGVFAKAVWSLVIAGALTVWAADKVRPPSLPVPKPTTRPSTGNGNINVVLIVMDTVRADHMSLYGYGRRTTPGLDALASESLVFDRAIASDNYSLPSHASLFTGVLPSQHGAHVRVQPETQDLAIRRTDSALHPEADTLASILKSRSFVAAGLSGNYVYLEDWTGLRLGFDAFDSRPRRQVGYHPAAFPVSRRLGVRRLASERSEWDAADLTRAATDFAHGAPSPFLLFVNYFDAHEPYVPRSGYIFRGDGLGSDARPIPAYDSEIAYVDARLSSLVARLRGAGVLDRTLFIITADHGEFFGEHGFTHHGSGAYEEVLHVPLLVRFPDQRLRGRVARPFGLHEIPRLVLDTLDGRPLDWIDAPPEPPRVLAQTWTRASASDRIVASPTVEPFANIIYGWPFKLIARRNGADELYNLVEDPGEERNLLASGAPEARSEQSRLRAALRDLPPAREGLDPTIPVDDLAALRGLGYISLRRPRAR